MKKVLMIIFMSIMSICTFAQTATFNLNAGGNFSAKDGTSFIVVPMVKQTASEIFQTLFINVGKLYKSNNNKTIITIDGRVITIRSYEPKIAFNLVNKVQEFDGSYYNLTFEIKDGKVKVAAPVIDETITNESGVRQKDFSKMVISFFTDGSLSAKYQQQATYTETIINNYVNAILTGINLNKDENDW